MENDSRQAIEAIERIVDADPEVRKVGATIDQNDPVINALIRALVERAQYLDEVGLDYLIFKLKTTYVQQEPGKGLSTNDFTNEYKNKVDALYANKDKGMKYKVVSSLPAVGEDGYLYLVPATSTSGKNMYEEYLWIGSSNRYELMGAIDTANIRTDYLPLSGGTLTGNLAVTSGGRITVSGNTVPTNVKLNGVSHYSTTGGVIDLGSIDIPSPGLYSVSVSLNGSTYSTNASGLISLPTLAHQVKLNGVTKTASASGLVDLGTIDIPDGGLTSVSVKVNGDTYASTSAGLITLPNLAHQVTMNGSTKTATSAGVIALGNVATSVKINGSSKTPSSGVVDLGNVVTSVKINSTSKTPTSGAVDLGSVVTAIKINGSTKNPSSGTVDLGTIGNDGISFAGAKAYYSSTYNNVSSIYILFKNNVLTGNAAVAEFNAQFPSVPAGSIGIMLGMGTQTSNSGYDSSIVLRYTNSTSKWTYASN